MAMMAVFTSIFVGIFVALLCTLLPPLLSGGRFAADAQSARERRLAEAKMNARLLRFDL